MNFILISSVYQDYFDAKVRFVLNFGAGAFKNGGPSPPPTAFLGLGPFRTDSSSDSARVCDVSVDGGAVYRR